MAAPTYLGAGAFVPLHSSSNHVAAPSVSEGDLMVAVITLTYSDADITAVPSGWTLATSIDQENAFRSGIYVYWKIATASEPSDYLWTVSGQGGGNNISSARIFAWSGIDAADPIDSTATTTDQTTSTSLVCPSVTTTVDDCALLCLAITSNQANVTFTPPGGMTEIHDGRATGGESWGAFTESLGTAGSTGTRTATASSTAPWHAVTVAIAPAGGGGTATPTAAAGAATVSASGESLAESTPTSAAGAATVSAVGGTLTVITSSAFKNNTGTVLASLTNVTAFVYNPTTGALVVKLTGQSTNGSGVLTLTDALIVSSTTYRVVYRNEDDGAEGMETVTAS